MRMELEMAAYQFLQRRPSNKYRFIRVLPERIKIPARIGQVFGYHLRSHSLDFFHVTINEFPGKIFHLLPVLISQE